MTPVASDRSVVVRDYHIVTKHKTLTIASTVNRIDCATAKSAHVSAYCICGVLILFGGYIFLKIKKINVLISTSIVFASTVRMLLYKHYFYTQGNNFFFLINYCHHITNTRNEQHELCAHFFFFIIIVRFDSEYNAKEIVAPLL